MTKTTIDEFIRDVTQVMPMPKSEVKERLKGIIEGVLRELKVGELRQWLNEMRIDDHKKMVTNEDIENWLGYNIDKK